MMLMTGTPEKERVKDTAIVKERVKDTAIVKERVKGTAMKMTTMAVLMIPMVA